MTLLVRERKNMETQLTKKKRILELSAKSSDRLDGFRGFKAEELGPRNVYKSNGFKTYLMA